VITQGDICCYLCFCGCLGTALLACLGPGLGNGFSFLAFALFFQSFTRFLDLLLHFFLGYLKFAELSLIIG
jgi:hypothetical protein